MNIEYWRTEIDEVDRELLRLLNRRARLAIKVGALKRAAGRPAAIRIASASCSPLCNKPTPARLTAGRSANSFAALSANQGVLKCSHRTLLGIVKLATADPGLSNVPAPERS